jgi:hypothetical protein
VDNISIHIENGENKNGGVGRKTIMTFDAACEI